MAEKRPPVGLVSDAKRGNFGHFWTPSTSFVPYFNGSIINLGCLINTLGGIKMTTKVGGYLQYGREEAPCWVSI